MYVLRIDRCFLVGIFFTIKECEEFIAFHQLEKYARIEEIESKIEFTIE